MTFIHSTWLASSAVVATETISGAIRDADSIAKAGTGTLLALGLILCGIVIIAIDRRRENSAKEERAERQQQYLAVLNHHNEREKEWQEERAKMLKSNQEIATALLETLASNATVITQLSERVQQCPAKTKP